jgi:CRISPR-associated protein Csm5
MVERNSVARVELLTDVHIGTGTELVRDIDWIAPGDQWVYFADSNRLLETVFAQAEADGKEMHEVAKIMAGSTLSDLRQMGWLTAADFGEKHPLFRYRLQGSPATAYIREQIKDVHGRPYLPGSSLKGALRTVLAVAAANELQPDLNKLGYNRSWAGQPIERDLFGRDPNHDLLRALQVGDSAPVSAEQLRLRRVNIYPTAGTGYRDRSRGLDVDVETLAQGTVLELPIHVPTELLTNRHTPFDRRRQEELARWERQVIWLEQLAAAGRQNARTLLEEEYRFFTKRADVPEVQRFYQQTTALLDRLQPNEFLLVLGWGGGWHTKTLNRYLKQDERAFDSLVSRYRLTRTGTHKPGDPFPKSRHLVLRGGRPAEPLGWVRVSVQSP